jgi:hypothetical protein
MIYIGYNAYYNETNEDYVKDYFVLDENDKTSGGVGTWDISKEKLEWVKKVKSEYLEVQRYLENIYEKEVDKHL